ncbi:MAG: GCN5-related N-acetyltransferase [Actinomycetia bacterium]|nr:GCN5-related N-acetyltransferase [Actinomycetes bacterium]
MQPDDVPACETTWDTSYRAMRARYGLPLPPRTSELADATIRRLRHLLSTDAAGSFVATDDDRVVGMAQSVTRDELWVLSLFAVLPDAQSRGVGRALLDAAVAYSERRRGLILCSRDPIAMRRYARAGFDLHPAFAAHGIVDQSRLPASPAVRAGSPEDAGLIASIDQEVRGAAHGGDLDALLGEGGQLLVHDDGGYAVVSDRPRLVAARSDDIASALLVAALRRAPSATPVDVGWITAPQQWALRVLLDAGLELFPLGPVALRGFDRPPAPYLPSGAYG